MNHPTLYTLPAPKVSKFALEWGFLPTRYLIMNSVDEVKSFTDECGKTGKWNGEDVEGFVVRGVIKQRLGVECPAGTKEKTSDANVEPPDGFIEPFFWKVKFDEPYLMYREWRELTRKLLAHRKKVRDGKGIKTAEDQNPVNPNKLRRPESKLYFRWVDTMISENPETFEDWDKGRGVVRVRDEFLRWRDSQQGKRELADVESGERKERAELETKKKAFDRTLLVPIAVPGCGEPFSRPIWHRRCLDLTTDITRARFQERRCSPLPSHTSLASATYKVTTYQARRQPRSLSKR